MRHTEPEYAEITPELRERLEKFRTEHEKDRLGNVANQVLFEDDNVRIWEMKLEPGEHSDLHHHQHEYYLVVFSGDLVAGIPGRKAVFYVSDGLELRPGEALFHAWADKVRGQTGAAPRNIETEARNFDATQLFEELGRHANASRVTFYPILAAGGRNQTVTAAEQSAFFTESTGNTQVFNRRHQAMESGNLRGSMRILAEATGGRSTAQWSAIGVSIDSRSLAPGDLFIAIQGPSFDGHDFIAQAFESGAAAAVSHRHDTAGAAGALLLVEDTMVALRRLGQAARERSRARFIGVTGSVGKTGTKEALARCLRAQAPTAASTGSLNNHWGLPLSLSRLAHDAAYGVFELGMNHPGEIRDLTTLLRPEIALIINVGMIFGLLSAIGATLTLPGIAGIVLTVGMAVDANVLVFERIREELKTAKGPARAIELGYERAFSAIIDANITTLIAAVILFVMGSGPVRGFSITLGLGIVTSVFTAIWVTRLLISIWMDRRRPKTIEV